MKKKVFYLTAIIMLSGMLSCDKNNDDINDITASWQGFRNKSSSSISNASVVFEYTPAPGQFINETEDIYTPSEANEYALRRLKSKLYLSLGGFGGYVIVGFDHSISNDKILGSGLEYDFAIKGNSFNKLSEPGIVYVMQDENSNGEPDDRWYQLKGAEYVHEGTILDYEVMYIKPSNKSAVKWRDNQSEEGEIDYLEDDHAQNTYYPLWIKESSYTLKGVRLKSNVTQKNGAWQSDNYGWGYADNFGDDIINEGTPNMANAFKIRNAIDENGESVELKYIDFIKVQCAVNDKAGVQGEISTEVVEFIDLHLAKR